MVGMMVGLRTAALVATVWAGLLGAGPVGAGQAQAAERMLQFSASVAMPFTNPENTGFEDRLVKEIFRRLGYSVEIDFVPAEWALINLDTGVDDGALGRVHGVTAAYPNIREIPEVAFVRDFVVFTRDPQVNPRGWRDLAGYNVGYITGWKIVERNVPTAKSLVRVADGAALFKLLAADRVDLIVHNRWGGLQLAQDLGIDEVRLVEPPLAQAPHYFILNSRHEALIEPAAQALREMRRDGTYQRIFDATLGHLVVD